MEYDVVILTESQYINPKKIDWYVQQVLDEDGFLMEALKIRGYKVTKKDWADTDFDWSTTKTAIFRTTWDYFHRYPEFKLWLEANKTKTRFINSAEQIQWNVDKHYMQDLDRKGINIVESHFIEAGTEVKLQNLHEELGWKESVLKPTVSGGARHTYRLNPENYDEHEAVFQEVLKEEAFMLQPFMNNILTKGEVSHVVIDGKYTHSVKKLAKKGDYRIQDDWGGTVHDYQASEKEIIFAENCVAECSPTPLYARVDVIYDNNNELALGELELIEPELWFRKNPKSADLLAEAISQILKEMNA